jgi:ABC-type multidrug transport system fused ATPase/permease subunit
LLSAILGDMIYLSDETIQQYGDSVLDEKLRLQINKVCEDNTAKIKLGGTISYVQQMPWIRNCTIRENILFNLPMDEARYNRTIEICQLASDLEMLPGGDLTEIGEKGINLSGGQKARVSLARAVYADRDIILMDDPVSALDANVKKKVFEQVFMDELRDKTRVLVTHAVDFIDRVDRIIIMENGRIKYIGTYKELQHSEEIKHIIETLAHNKGSDDDDSCIDEQDEDAKRVEEEKDDEVTNFLSLKGTSITEDENEEIIDVGWSIYANFFVKNGTWVVYTLVLPLFIPYTYLIVLYTYQLGYWVQHSSDKNIFWNKFWYVTLTPIGYSTLITLIFFLITFSTVRISKILHKQMLTRICNAPINLYFDKTPSGKILNRFSKDINKVDDSIGQ